MAVMPRFRLRVRNREVMLPDAGELVLGRDVACDVLLDDRLASRRHAVVRSSAEGVEVVAERTLNGTRVNGELFEGARSLRHGDRLQIGSSVLLLVDTQSARSGNASTARLRSAVSPSSPKGRPR